VSNPPVATVVVTEEGKNQLSTLRKRTGIKNWNVLCRWAICYSLSDRSRPPKMELANLSNVEMTWTTFGGQHAELFSTLIRARCNEDGLEINEENLREQFRLHLHRGLSNLVGLEETKTLEGFLKIAGRSLNS